MAGDLGGLEIANPGWPSLFAGACRRKARALRSPVPRCGAGPTRRARARSGKPQRARRGGSSRRRREPAQELLLGHDIADAQILQHFSERALELGILEGVVARSRASNPVQSRESRAKAVQPWSGSSRSPVSSRRGGHVVGDPRDSPCATAGLPVSRWRSGSSGWGAGGHSDSLWRKGRLPPFWPGKAGAGPVRGHGGASAGAVAGGVAGPVAGAVMEIVQGSTVQPEALLTAPAAGAVKSRRFPCRSCDGGRAGVRARAVTGAVQMVGAPVISPSLRRSNRPPPWVPLVRRFDGPWGAARLPTAPGGRTRIASGCPPRPAT